MGSVGTAALHEREPAVIARVATVLRAARWPGRLCALMLAVDMGAGLCLWWSLGGFGGDLGETSISAESVAISRVVEVAFVAWAVTFAVYMRALLVAARAVRGEGAEGAWGATLLSVAIPGYNLVAVPRLLHRVAQVLDPAQVPDCDAPGAMVAAYRGGPGRGRATPSVPVLAWWIAFVTAQFFHLAPEEVVRACGVSSETLRRLPLVLGGGSGMLAGVVLARLLGRTEALRARLVRLLARRA